LNTTNPYAQYPEEGAMSELDDYEGDKPVYVLVFGDEEERDVWRSSYSWKDWASLQIERGDEALVANFDIDLRILGFLEWDSDDSKTSMYTLWDELAEETGTYLGQWYNGEHWQNYVDAIIGITFQSTPADSLPVLGLSPWPEYLDQGKTFILLKWPNTYWEDDNLVQHEVSHLFYADDHLKNDPTCCVMATHTHYLNFIGEDGYLFVVFRDVLCAFISYDWCTSCDNVINAYKLMYQFAPQENLLILRHKDPCYPKCSFLIVNFTELIEPGCITFDSAATYVFEVCDVHVGYEFNYWLVDGWQKVSTPQ
jgi:hypothetical protein